MNAEFHSYEAHQKTPKKSGATARKKAHFCANLSINYLKMSDLKIQQKKQRIS
jgi:hypothetical protein